MLGKRVSAERRRTRASESIERQSGNAQTGTNLTALNICKP